MLVEAVDEMIVVGYIARDWEEAVRESGRLLVESGVVEPKYVDAMIRVVKELGPYAVIAPGVAIPHARPEDGSKRLGASIVVLGNEVNFGSHNDPVKIVIGFAANDKKEHLKLLKEIAEMLSNKDLLLKLKNAKTKDEVKAIIRELGPEGPH